ncbi:hypothetical protein CSC03_4339 [Enterobacter hormaechei]|nr:hypothetical protein CSC03_4339 [Enterobacter hormaechei]
MQHQCSVEQLFYVSAGTYQRLLALGEVMSPPETPDSSCISR